MVQVRRHGWVCVRCRQRSLFSDGLPLQSADGRALVIYHFHSSYNIETNIFCEVSELRDFIRSSSFSRKQTTRHCSLFDLLFFLQKKLICIFFAYLVFLHINRNPTFRTSKKTQKEFVKDTITCRLFLLSLYIFCRHLFVWG